MRWFNTRRFLVSLMMMPVFMVCLIINRVCLLLDHLLFPLFTRQSINNPVFIVAAPRSATTYLFHVLAAGKENFTAFRLWEIVFAPSIIQKYFFIGFFFCDRSIGSPVKRFVLFLGNKLFGNFKHIHKIGLNLPEEDEAILLWNMSTVYLNFFFPDTHHFDNYFAFDDALKPRLQKKIMRYYAGCIRRHNYVFNRGGTKRFLSKNPAMMSKVRSLYQQFPQAMIVTIARCPAKTIPSTVALNNRIYGFFTSRQPSEQINARTKEILINWYKMADRYIKEYFKDQTIHVDFNGLIKNDPLTINELCCRLGLEKNIFYSKEKPKEEDHVSRNNYAALNENELEQVLKELPFLAGYCK